MLYPCLFSSMCFDKKAPTVKELSGRLKDIDREINILARIISTGSEGFKNAKCAEKELIVIYNEIINKKNLKQSKLKKNKQWISRYLKSNFEDQITSDTLLLNQQQQQQHRERDEDDRNVEDPGSTGYNNNEGTNDSSEPNYPGGGFMEDKENIFDRI